MTAHISTDVRNFLEYLDGVCRYSGHTLRAYRTGLDRYADFLRRRRRTVRTATFEDVLDYARSLRDAKPATAALRLAAVRRLHGYLHALGHVERDVAALVPSPRRDRGRRPAPATDIVRRARDTIERPRDRALFGLLYGSALRISEVRLAMLADLDLERRQITVLGKGRAWRTVELDGYTAEALTEYLEVRGRRRCRYLFATPRPGIDEPISETPIRRMLEQAARAVGVSPRELTPHSLRRARGRALRRAGADPFTVQAIYGHSSLSQTAHYVGDSDAPSLPADVRARLELELVRHTSSIDAV
jgi:site-specific recombinase XerD